jgi:hypothetical protein
MTHRKIIQILNRLNKKSCCDIGRHISIAVDGEDLWNMSNSEFYSCLEKYEIELEMDVQHEDVEKIIKDSMHLLSEDLLEEE